MEPPFDASTEADPPYESDPPDPVGFPPLPDAVRVAGPPMLMVPPLA